MPLQDKTPFIALTHKHFRYYLSGRFLALVAYQMMAVALGQHVFEQTRNPLYLGYLGLSLFLPKFCLSLIAGHTADRFDRRLIVLLCRTMQTVLSLCLIILLVTQPNNLLVLYGLLVLMGTFNTFEGPASQALVTQLVPSEHFSNAVTWNSWFFQIAFIVGPVLAGLIYSINPLLVFWMIAGARLIACILVILMKSPKGGLDPSELNFKSLLAGIHYLREKRILLGIISLDLFAVLLGGAVALLPFFANEILKVGPTGLGILRAAPATGAALMALSMAFLPSMKRPGHTMLRAVVVFGVCTIAFALSRNFLFSLFCLAVLGAADMISVVIRGTLVQTLTPPAMRGRVSAINLVFIGASNELGEFESGLTAAWFGVVPAVLVGGIGTLLVVFLWNRLFPEIGKYSE